MTEKYKEFLLAQRERLWRTIDKLQDDLKSAQRHLREVENGLRECDR